VVVEVKCNRDLGTADDALFCMNEEPNSTTVQHVTYLPKHTGTLYNWAASASASEDTSLDAKLSGLCTNPA